MPVVAGLLLVDSCPVVVGDPITTSIAAAAYVCGDCASALLTPACWGEPFPLAFASAFTSSVALRGLDAAAAAASFRSPSAGLSVSLPPVKSRAPWNTRAVMPCTITRS